MEIVLFGAPGVGKGTQAKLLSEKLDIPHVSTGDILRAAVSSKSELGLQVEEIMAKGELVPNDLIGKIVKESLYQLKDQNGFILDGYPRTIDQVSIFNQICKELNYNNVCLLEIQVPFEIIINRLTKRRLCTECNSIINVDNSNDGYSCPKCGTKNSLIQRDDDSFDVVTKRLEIYKERTEPIIDFYRENNCLRMITINGQQDLDKVAYDISSELVKICV